MKGETTLATWVLIIFNVAWVTLVILLPFIFNFMSYNVIMEGDRLDRESLMFGEGIIASECLAEEMGGYPVKGLLSESKISALDLSCFNYPKSFHLRIYNETWEQSFGDATIFTDENSITSVFPASIKYSDKVLPVLVDLTMS